MPIYDFRCTNKECNELLANYYLESWKNPNPVCEVCKGPTEKEIGAGNISFKGLPHGDNHYNGAKNRYPQSR